MDKLAIRVFVSVAEAGGFSAAARELGQSKSAASRHIAALEEELGAQLLKRSTRSVKVTDSGYAYLERCRALIADLDDPTRQSQRCRTNLGGCSRSMLPCLSGSAMPPRQWQTSWRATPSSKWR